MFVPVLQLVIIKLVKSRFGAITASAKHSLPFEPTALASETTAKPLNIYIDVFLVQIFMKIKFFSLLFFIFDADC